MQINGVQFKVLPTMYACMGIKIPCLDKLFEILNFSILLGDAGVIKLGFELRYTIELRSTRKALALL